MIEERAQVVAVEGDNVLVQTQRQSSCGGCAVKSGCGTSVLAGIVGQKMTQLTLPNTLGAKPGDEVLLGMAEHALVAGSLLMYVLPLLMLMLGALGGELLVTQLGMDAELTPIVGGVLGFVLAIWLVRGLLRKSATGRHMQPVMLRIIAR
ncbi:MAG: SoxR reducing system RseC family protein [Gammaproteobacteria bacterium]|nr:SoxR reducing system RseC family protein [Gammaproteobacteria bacterium]